MLLYRNDGICFSFLAYLDSVNALIESVSMALWEVIKAS